MRTHTHTKMTVQFQSLAPVVARHTDENGRIRGAFHTEALEQRASFSELQEGKIQILPQRM